MREITPRIALELIAHEGIVTEAYKDSVGVWTWSVGITNASGHQVFPRYKDKPQPLEHCIGVYLWLLRERYLPPVLAAFGTHEPTEAELGAALSFHWNTGAIGRATWIKRFVAGDRASARKAILDWARPAALLPRRRAEQALFFCGTWSADDTALVYGVAKPSYKPSRGKRIAVGAIVESLFATSHRVPTSAPVMAENPKLSWFDRLFD